MADSVDDLKALLYRITEEIWNQGNVELIDELIADDFIDNIEMPGIEGTGKERYRASVVMMRNAFPDYRNPIDFVVAEGDIVATFGRTTGTHKGEFMGLAPTGRQIDLLAIGALRFRNGQAVERWGVGDNLLMMQQLGLIPTS
jgi:predicted ester cyclase